MEISKFYKALTEKWGDFRHTNHCYDQVETTFISEHARLNLFYDPCNQDEIAQLFTDYFGTELPPQLANFYRSFNGCRLFSDSLCVYGFHMYPDETYEPFDIIKENKRIQFDVKNADEFIFFGSLGGQFLLAYEKETPDEVFAINIDNSKVVKKYADLDNCFASIFTKLLDEYDVNGKKKHVSKKLLSLPVLANMTFDKHFL